MAKLLEIPTFLPNKSVVLNAPEEFLLPNYSAGESRNMEFYNSLLQGRLGLAKFDTKVLDGPILLMDQFWKFTGSWYFMICTTKDILKYDFANLRYDYLTPLLIGTGTNSITIGTGASAYIVIGTGVNFTTEGIKAGDYIKIGTGATHTGSTWYQVSTKDSATQLTLTTAATACSGSQYVIRKTFAGSQSDMWCAATYVDASLGDVWIATNGVDTPVRYTGTGQVQALTNLPSGFTSARYVDEYKDRLIFAWTVEGGNQPQRIRWSAVADCEGVGAWDDLDFMDFIEDGYWITGIVKFQDYLIIPRERDAIVFRWVGGNYTFDYEKSSSFAGCWAARSLVPLENALYYYGPDNKFHSWNLLSDTVISESIYPYTQQFDPNLEAEIFGWQAETKNEIRWFVPYTNVSYNNACIVYNYEEDIIQIWEYQKEQACCSIGEYVNTTDLYVDDILWADLYVDESDGFWDARDFLSGAPIIVYGGYDGIIRNADKGYDDDGTAYSRIFESIRNNFKLPQMTKRLWKQQHWLESDISGSVTVSLKLDDKVALESTTKTISLINAARDIIKEKITWNKHAENFKTRIEATNHFAMLGFINFLFPKGKTSR